MRRMFLAILVVALLPVLAAAQDRPYSGLGYVFFAPGGASPGNNMLMHFGVGGEGFAYKGLAAGAEIGMLGPKECLSEGIGLFSPNASYHFNRNAKLVPFVTGGYSLGFRQGIGNMVNFGGGVNYWFKPRLGLHLAFRDHLYPPENAHLWEFRFGLSFR